MTNGFNFTDNTYETLPSTFWKKQTPRIFAEPKVLIYNQDLAQTLGIGSRANHPELLATGKMGDTHQLLNMAYAGYQFGHFAILGDGRAALLGEHVVPETAGVIAGQRYDIQLKGSGLTHFSRSGSDGLAAIGPMLREYMISEFLAAVGIATTRSLAVVATGETVHRMTGEPGAVLTRVAKSHLRVGTFNYAIAQTNREELQALADYAIARHYPDIAFNKSYNPYVRFFRQVVLAQAELVAQWQCLGFIHGVLNTDNVSIAGETLDLGPCAFMEAYDPEAVFSAIDKQGRYAYSHQPSIMQWNLTRFAESLLPLFDSDEAKAIHLAKQELAMFMPTYGDAYMGGMRQKLGFMTPKMTDSSMVKGLLQLMHTHQLDYTNTLASLATGTGPLFALPEAQDWLTRWQQRLDSQVTDSLSKQSILDIMTRHNPLVIPRNHLVEAALTQAEKGNLAPYSQLLTAVQNPYSPSPEYMTPAGPDYTCVTYCGT